MQLTNSIIRQLRYFLIKEIVLGNKFNLKNIFIVSKTARNCKKPNFEEVAFTEQ